MKFEIRGHEVADLLDRLPPGVTTLSLDCFDTILWRAVQAPRDVFAEIAIPGGGVEPRMWAEGQSQRFAAARRTGEVKLADIYRHLMPTADEPTVEAAVTHELALEARHCFAFGPTVELIRRAKYRGLGVVIVSDMYVTEAQLRALLTAVAGPELLALTDHVFVSSEYGCGKSNGLFDHVLETIGAAPAQVIHIGDNPKADFHAPHEKGMHAVLLRQFDAAADQRLRMEAASAVLIDPTTRVSRPAHQFHRAAVALRGSDDPIRALGHDVIGPALHAFALWVRQELDAMTARLGRPVRPLFLMRDGFLPLRCFETLFPDAGARPVEISRVVAARACLTDRAALDSYVHTSLDNLSLESLARQIGMQPHEYAKALRGGDRRARRTAFAKAALAPEMVRKLLARADAFGDRLAAHLQAEGVAPGDAVMLVDLGYRGTVQNVLTPFLEQRLGLTVAGRYLILRDGQQTGYDKAGMLDTRHYETRTLNALAAYVGVLEQLCNVSQGSTVDYKADGTPIREKGGTKAAQSAVRDAVQAAALAYLADADRGTHRRAGSDCVDARVRSAGAILARLMFMPSEAEVRIFEAFDHDVNFGTDESVKFVDADAAALGLRRQGLSYINDAARVYVPAELQRHGLPLTLSLFSSLRFGLELRSSDFDAGGIEVPVILADARDQSLRTMRAMPTAEGFYRLLVPVGQGRFTAAIQLGAICEHLQLDELRFDRVAGMQPGGTPKPVAATHVTDGMTEIAPGVLAATPAGMILVPPPQGATEPLVLTLLFRPLRWRKAAGEVALAKAA